VPRIRTGYSFRAAVGGIDEVLSRVVEIGLPVAPICDRASTFGFVRWSKEATKAGLRPVFGVELGVVHNTQEKKPTIDYWTFYAIDDIEAINRLVNRATEQFRYEPLLNYDQVNKAKGVIKIAGHRAKLDLVEVDENTFYGLSPASSRGHVRRALEMGLPIVATSDNVFPRPDDLPLYEVVLGRWANTQTYDQWIQTDEEWIESVSRLRLPPSDLRVALDLRNKLLESCKAKLRVAELVKPEREAPLVDMCEEGAKKLGIDLGDPVYRERLDRELRLIHEKEFEDYFYLVGDLCRWARKRMAVGPARGSSCGSLVCYLLEITTVDPIPFGLIFERFIDLNRSDLPDIDIDFSDQQRHRVFEYMADKYGSDHVARLGTVTTYKAKSALNETGAALRVPFGVVEKIASALVERSSADARATDSIEDALAMSSAGRDLLRDFPSFRIAARLEGHVRHYSQHAAGVVVASEPIVRFVAVDHRTGATMCDKKDAEDDLGLLKIDALGLTQLSVLEDALEAVGMSMEDLQAVPIDDPAAFAVLNRGEFSGIFQWNGNALRGLTRQVVVDNFEDIVAISALARPGPLATGGSHTWVVRRMGGGKVESLHPMLTDLTRETYGVVVYQEQVMRIVREMGNMSWEDTSAIRKAMSKTLGDEFFAKFKDKFVTGAGENGVPADVAGEIWSQINTFGAWAFNKSHAVAYGYISYWCCWLKAHHPFEFAAATLTHESDPSRQIEILREMKNEGYSYVPVDAELSTDKWTSGEVDEERVLVGPLSSVKGVGPSLVAQSLEARRSGDPLPSRVLKLLEGATTDIDSLFPIEDRVKKICPDLTERNIHTVPTPIGSIVEEMGNQHMLVLGRLIKINPRDKNEPTQIEQRDGKVWTGKTEYLQVRIEDDTGAILASVSTRDFERIGKGIIDKGREGKAIWALKGKLFAPGQEFVMVLVEAARYIGDMENDE
jgi:DNA polymerase III alpha subunit